MSEDNFYKNLYVISKCGKGALQKLLECELARRKLTVEQFVQSHQHDIYHLHEVKRCCQCPPGNRPWSHKILHPAQIKLLLDKTNHLPGHNHSSSSPFCCSPAKTAISLQDLDMTILRSLLKNFGSTNLNTQSAVEQLMQYRNTYAHATTLNLSEGDFKSHKQDIETAIIDISSFCGIPNASVKQELDDTYQRPLDKTLSQQYHNKLMEENRLYDKVEEKVNQLQQGFVKFQDEVRRKIGNRRINKAKCRKKSKKVRGSRKENFIDQAYRRVQTHKQDKTYVKTSAVKRGLEILEKHKTLTLVSKSGVGKTKVCLQIASHFIDREIKPVIFYGEEIFHNRHIINPKDNLLIIIEDLFGKRTAQFQPEKHKDFLDEVRSWIQDSESRGIHFILTVSAVGSKVNHILKQHEMFNKIKVLNLDDDCPLTTIEKRAIFYKHAEVKGVAIRDKPCHSYCNVVMNKKEQLEICSCQTKLIVETVPYIGFPECCYLFFMDKDLTRIGSKYFKHPSKTLMDQINSLFEKGIGMDVISMYKYVLLVYMATTDRLMPLSVKQNDKLISNATLKDLFKLFDKHNVNIRAQVINKTLDLMEGEFLEKVLTNEVRKTALDFQHETIRNAVLISYGVENPNKLIKSCDLVFFLDHIRPTCTSDCPEEDDKQHKATIPVDIQSILNYFFNVINYQDEAANLFIGEKPDTYQLLDDFCLLGLKSYTVHNDDDDFGYDSDDVESLYDDWSSGVEDLEEMSLQSPPYSKDETEATSTTSFEEEAFKQVTTDDQEYERRNIPRDQQLIYPIIHTSQCIGKYIKDYVLDTHCENDVHMFVEKVQSWYRYQHVTGLLDGLTYRGSSSSLITEQPEKWKELLLSYGSPSVICGLVRPCSSKDNHLYNANFIFIDDEKLISEHLVNKLSSRHVRRAFVLGQYLFRVGIDEGNRQFIETVVERISKEEIYNIGISFFLDGFLDHGKNFKRFSMDTVNNLILKQGSIETLLACCRPVNICTGREQSQCILVERKELLMYFERRCEGYFINLNQWENYLDEVNSRFVSSFLEYGAEDYAANTPFDLVNLFSDCRLFAREAGDEEFVDALLSKMLDAMKTQLADKFFQTYLNLFLSEFQVESHSLLHNFPSIKHFMSINQRNS